jgi:hypothetical protein
MRPSVRNLLGLKSGQGAFYRPPVIDDFGPYPQLRLRRPKAVSFDCLDQIPNAIRLESHGLLGLASKISGAGILYVRLGVEQVFDIPVRFAGEPRQVSDPN